MTKIAYNACWGGFGLSEEASRRLVELDPETYEELDPDWGGLPYDADRSEPNLIKVIEDMGDRANGRHANLQIANIPDGIPWTISEYDGSETVKVDWKALVGECVSASELDFEIARDRMVKALDWDSTGRYKKD